MRNELTRIVPLLLVLLSGCPRVEEGRRSALTSWIEKHLETSAGKIPGASVAVIRNYRIEWAQGFGQSDAEHGTAVTPATLFQACSVSKAISAVAAVIAFEDHKLPIDENIDDILKALQPNAEVGRWELPNKDYPADPVTLRLLLSHTAGTSDFRYSGYRYGYYTTPPGPIDRIPTMYQELNGLPPANTPAIAVIRKPGVTWHYSAPGFTVVQALLMDIYNQDFASIMQQLVLAPLGMSDSTFVQPVPEDLIPRMAVPYLPDGHPLPDGPRVFNSAASGGLVTTPTDLAKFVIALQKALKGESQGRITSRIAHQVMERQPGRLEPGSCLETADPGVRACQSSWGLGFDVNVNRYSEHQKDGAPTGGYFEHTGFNSGFLALMMGSKTGGNGVVIMLNVAPLDMSGPVPPAFVHFLTDLVRRVADEEGWN